MKLFTKQKNKLICKTQKYLILLTLLLGSILNQQGAFAQTPNEEVIYPRTNTPNQLEYKNETFNVRTGGRAIIEVYAVGAGGGDMQIEREMVKVVKK